MTLPRTRAVCVHVLVSRRHFEYEREMSRVSLEEGHHLSISQAAHPPLFLMCVLIFSRATCTQADVRLQALVVNTGIECVTTWCISEAFSAREPSLLHTVFLSGRDARLIFNECSPGA